MNNYFAKIILYAYPVVDEFTKQIDELISKKAIFSMNDCSPALSQFEKVVDLNVQKAVLLIIKDTVEKILKRFSDEDLLHLDYKYFRRKDRSEYEKFDYLSRTYFRRQVKIFNKFCERLEKADINDNWFKTNCLNIDFFNNLLKIVIEKEVYSFKNKNSINKCEKKKIDEKIKEIYRITVA